MSLYDNAFPSNYEEIRTFYPVWYLDVLEMDSIWRATGNQLDVVQAGVDAMVGNQFVASADEATIGILENFLGLDTSPSRPLLERRQLVASRFTSTPHIGALEIKRLIASFTEGATDVTLVGGEIRVTITRDLVDPLRLGTCLNVLLDRIPAHLGLLLIDRLKPIPFSEQTNQFCLAHLHVKLSIPNWGNDSFILLNNGRKLDGAWLLDQHLPGIGFHQFRIASAVVEQENAHPSTFAVGPIAVHRDTRMNLYPVRVQFQIPLPNVLDGKLILLDGRKKLDGTWKLDYGFPSVKMGFFWQAKARQTYQVSATLTQDSMWRLDSTLRLDGKRKLNAAIIKESI